MQNYSFEYANVKYTKRLLLISFLSFLVLLVLSLVAGYYTGITGIWVIAVVVPLVIFFVNMKNIKKQGTAVVYDSYTTFNLFDGVTTVVYATIAQYQIERYNGVYIKFRFADGSRFVLEANSNFCNAQAFDLFCADFEKVLQQANTANNLAITRQKSMFEQAWMLPFLVVMSLVLVGSIVFALIIGKSVPPSFYTTFAVIIPMWIGYWNARKTREQK